MKRRTPPGVRELKRNGETLALFITLSRTPPGVRELKLDIDLIRKHKARSHPSRGA